MVRTKPIGKEVSHEFVAKLSKTISRGYSCQLVGTNDCNILNGRGILHKKNFLIPTRNIKHFISLICGLKCWSKKVSLPYWNQQWSSSLQSETFFQSSYGQRQTFLFHILNTLNKYEYHHHHQGHGGHIIIIIAVNISSGELDTSFVGLNTSSRLSDKNTAAHCCCKYYTGWFF